MTLIGKLADQEEDKCLKKPSSLSPNSGFLNTPEMAYYTIFQRGLI